MNISNLQIEDLFREHVGKAHVLGHSMMLAIIDDVKHETRDEGEFRRQVRLCSGIGWDRMRAIVTGEIRGGD